MSKIPTAEEFSKNFTTGKESETIQEYISNMLIEFAKLHVEAALKASHANQQLPIEDLEFTLDAYPLTNIQ
jgi:hypothetical protein